MGSSGSIRKSSDAPQGSGELVKEDRADAGAVPRPPPRSAAPPKEAWGLQAAASPKTGDGGPPAQGLADAGGSGLVLAADVGGTNSRFMLYLVDPNEAVAVGAVAPGRLLTEKKYANLRYSSFEAVFEAFMKDAAEEGLVTSEVRPSVACLAVAGVVEANTCRLTNLDWIIDGPMLEERFGLQCIEVINDFVAQGYGTLTLGADEKIHIYGPKTALSGAPIACIGAGTGLGQCFLTADAEGEYTAFPSEGGHAEFAPRGAGNDETQIELLRYLKVKFSGWNRISFERVVSGKGICNTYEFLAYKNPGRIDKKVHSEYLASRENAGIVAQNARPGTLCYETLEIFADCYGAVCGTFALQVMPFGGFYISGGVTQKLLSFLRETSLFLEAYHDKGRVSPMLQDVPLYIVKGDDLGQRGAHLRSVRLYQIWAKRASLTEVTEGKPVSKARSARAVTLVPPRNAGFADIVKELSPEDTALEASAAWGKQVSAGAGVSLPPVRCSTPT